MKRNFNDEENYSVLIKSREGKEKVGKTLWMEKLQNLTPDKLLKQKHWKKL